MVYVALLCDRHYDPVIKVFSTPELAIECAKKFAKDSARNPEYIKESSIEGWLYCCEFSTEGDDYVRVSEEELT